jgi:hydrogenase-4 component B
MTLVWSALSLILLAGVVALVRIPKPGLVDAAYRVLVLAGCGAGVLAAVGALSGGAVSVVRFAGHMPGGDWEFGVDPLSAVFLLAIFGVGAAAAVYGVTYQSRERARGPVRLAHALFTVLLAALALVVTSRAVVPFLAAWEIMAMANYCLIVFDSERRDVRRAGLLYLVATHTSMLTLLALYSVWGEGARDLTFASLALRAPALPAGGAVVLVLALIGFGIKAGMVPLHFWLPEAHSAAPSHISAVMSGVVIKMGIYGLMRVVVMIAVPAAWWGWVVLSLGAVSGILGVVWALAQHDIKRLLAFHSVENIGIILLGIGAGSLGMAYGHPLMAALGFAGAALHTLNHALFKSLLFLGAGSVVHATGIRDIDRLGGLAKRMPVTAAAFLVGSVAIVGLPPLNGFLSEWLVYRSLMQGGIAAHGGRAAILWGAALAMIGALALACFAKVVGVMYLGTARDARVVADAHESPSGITGPLIGLSLACVAIGLLPVVVVPALLRVGASMAGLSPRDVQSAIDPDVTVLTVFMVALAAAMGLGWGARALLLRRRTEERAGTWACGFSAQTVRMQYTASSFAAPLLVAFSPVAGVQVHRGARSFATHPIDPVLRRVLLPAWEGVRAGAGRFRPIQQGRVGLQLLYVAAALTALLFYLILAD